MVSDVVPEDDLEATVAALSATLLKAPRPANRAVKEYARAALTMDIQGAIEFARNLHATVNSSSGMRG